jgi:molybdopterin-guanine dinucleotide biosynthesis protein MobB
MLTRHSPPVLGFAAYSGAGKTTLLRKILPLLRVRGLRVGVIKRAHHDFDIDLPGKDSYELRKAGATQMLIASHRRQALITETGDGPEPQLGELLQRLDGGELNLVLVEVRATIPSSPLLPMAHSRRRRTSLYLT